MAATPTNYSLSQTAYIKLILHSLKHPSAAVNGLLLGHLSSSTVTITDSIPLSHSNIGLLPSLELALIQVEDLFGKDGVGVVGYYHGNERWGDREIGSVVKRTGDHVFRYFPQAAVLMVDNEKLAALAKGKGRDPAVQLYTRDSSKSWRQDESTHLTLKEPAANVVLLDYISSEKWQHLVDFDDHLDDISKDWLNPDLFK